MHVHTEPHLTIVGNVTLSCTSCDTTEITPFGWRVVRPVFLGDTAVPIQAEGLWRAASNYARARKWN